MKNNPYVGPRPYGRGDQQNFHGRKRETRDLLSLIMAERAVLFYAQSGAGKTSLLNAQIIPALEDEGFNVLPMARVGGALPPRIKPERVKNVFVFSALMGLAGATPTEATLADTLRSRTLHSFLQQICQDDIAQSPGVQDDLHDRPPLVIFDQFEEIFTAHRDRWQDARGFFEQLRTALRSMPSLGVVFAMREDFVAEMDPYAALLPRRLRARFRMERLGYEGALEAVTRPALDAGCPFEPGAAERLVDDLRRIKTRGHDEDDVVLGPFVEPVNLQVVCSQLWENLPEQHDTAIQWEEVQEFGNIDRALTDFYESALTNTQHATRNTVSERQLRQWFGEQLITPMQTRGLALRGEAQTAGLPNAAVDVLDGRHLIRAEVRAGARWYELSHDRLIDPILRSNRAWEAARQTPLRLAAQRWRDAGRDPGILYRGQTLLNALAWAEEHPAEIEPYEREFLEASQQAQANFERERRQSRRIRNLAIIATIVSAVAVIALLFARAQRLRADEQAALASEQATLATIRQLVAQSSVVLDTYPQRSLLLALEALNIAQDEGQLISTAEDTLRRALANAGGRMLTGHQGTARVVAISHDDHWVVVGGDATTAHLWDLTSDGPEAAFIDLPDHQEKVQAAAFSHDNRWLVTGDGGGTVRLWDLASPDPSANPTILNGHEGAINAVAISSDDRWLVTGSGDKTVRLWDLTTFESVVLDGHDGAINAVVISDDDHWLVTASDDETARLWDLADPPAAPIVLSGHKDRVWCAAFSPDHHWLATGSVDATVRLWDLTAADPAAEPIVLHGHEEHVWAVAFTSDSRMLVTGSVDTTARLWDLTAPDPSADPTVLRGHNDQIWAMALSNDDHWLATGSRDTTVRLWDLNAPDPATASFALHGHEGAIRALAISDDNYWLVTGSEDGTARLWGLTNPDSRGAPMILRGHTSVVRAAPSTPDGHWLVTASGDGTARAWDLTARQPAASAIVLPGHTSAIYVAAISPDGRWLVTGSQDTNAHLWDLQASDITDSKIVLSGHTSAIRAVAFSPDNKWLVTASRDSTARLWDLTAPDPRADPILLTDHTMQIRVATFSHDSKWLVTGGDDKVPRLWDLTAPDPSADPTELPGHTADIRAVAFSPDNRWLVTGGTDRVPRLWDLSADAPSAASIELQAHTDVIRVAAFTPDSRWLVTGSADNTAIVWDLSVLPDVPEPLHVLKGHNDEIRSIAIKADGQQLLTGSEDATARLWDLSRPDPGAGSVVLPGHGGPVWFVSFAEGSRWIATASQDGTARLWTPAPLGELVNLACGIAGRNLSLEEWEEYRSDETYHRTCPDLPAGKGAPEDAPAAAWPQGSQPQK